MKNVFEAEICSVCKKSNTNNCNEKIIKEKNNSIEKIYCSEYVKDSTKIKGYVEPLFITAPRTNIKLYEI